MNWTREQAQVYLAQGSLCRAAVTMQEVVKAEPTNSNREFLAEIYMAQGLNDDAFALYAQAAGKPLVASSDAYVN
jgi:Tfp pilus assembly protein PilF